MHMRNTVPVMGLKTPWRNGTLLDVAREVLNISHAGLVARNRLDSDGQDESGFLSPLEEVVARGALCFRADDPRRYGLGQVRGPGFFGLCLLSG